MKPKRKNTFFTFVCSFLPGAAEMYMGFMKMGVGLMAIFFACLMIPGLFRLSDVTIGAAALVWFYGFFHARNMAACDSAEFESITDHYIWEEFNRGKAIHLPEGTARKWLSACLILLGAGILWNNFADLADRMIPDYLWETLAPIVHNIPEVVLSVFLIILGIYLIRGKKEELDAIEA